MLKSLVLMLMVSLLGDIAGGSVPDALSPGFRPREVPAAERRVVLPHVFEPRGYQIPLFRAFDQGVKRGVHVWHRRAGKDLTDLNLLIKKTQERVGAYYYYFPTSTMARRILWMGADREGRRFLDYIPKCLIKSVHNQEMMIEFTNGSVLWVQGTDRREIVGTNAIGVVFSEYSLQDPRAWNYVRPILRENGGWALFNFTPRGWNHAKRLFDMAASNERWFCQLLTIENTGVLTGADIDEDREEGMSEELVQQEYYCSFDYGMEGAYYAKQIGQLRKKGQITSVPHDPAVPVFTFWDLGIGDSMAIWFAQFVRQEIHLIEYFEDSGEPFEFYAKELRDRPYVYGRHYVPHDAHARDIKTGKSLITWAKGLGIALHPVPIKSLEYGHQCVRSILNRCWFDAKLAEFGVDCLLQYQKQKNEKMSTEYRPVFKRAPQEDWSIHCADAFRYLAEVYRAETHRSKPFDVANRHGHREEQPRDPLDNWGMFNGQLTMDNGQLVYSLSGRAA